MLELLKTIIADFHRRQLPANIAERELSIPLHPARVATVVGPRRSGKTFLLYSLIQRLEKKIPREKIVYIDFADERLTISAQQLHLVLDAYQQLFPKVDLKDVYLFFDEIQEVPGWEQFIRRLEGSVTKKIFLTGSSSKLLSREIASVLRGRTLSYELLPFTFREYLGYRGIDSKDIHSTRNKNLIASQFERFLSTGGYPEIFDFDEKTRVRALQSYVDIMLYRDIIERYRIGQTYVVKDMMRRLIAGNACLFSVHKYYNELKSRGVRIGKDALYEFLNHFADAYLVFQLNKYDRSAAKQEQALKKIYVNDTGLGFAYNFDLSRNVGRMLETMIFLELRKAGRAAYYAGGNGECDFLIQEGRKIISAVQVCHRLDDNNREREIRGLTDALEKFRLPGGLILTSDQEMEMESAGKKISVKPAWKWILEQKR
jgi:predicted AAA+ superfamily ATPase